MSRARQSARSSVGHAHPLAAPFEAPRSRALAQLARRASTTRRRGPAARASTARARCRRRRCASLLEPARADPRAAALRRAAAAAPRGGGDARVASRACDASRPARGATRRRRGSSSSRAPSARATRSRARRRRDAALARCRPDVAASVPAYRADHASRGQNRQPRPTRAAVLRRLPVERRVGFAHGEQPRSRAAGASRSAPGARRTADGRRRSRGCSRAKNAPLGASLAEDRARRRAVTVAAAYDGAVHRRCARACTAAASRPPRRSRAHGARSPARSELARVEAAPALLGGAAAGGAPRAGRAAPSCPRTCSQLRRVRGRRRPTRAPAAAAARQRFAGDRSRSRSVTGARRARAPAASRPRRPRARAPAARAAAARSSPSRSRAASRGRCQAWRVVRARTRSRA